MTKTMKICIYFDPANCRHWIASLAKRLVSDHKADIVIAASEARPLPTHVARLLGFEAGYYHDKKATGATELPVAVLEKAYPCTNQGEGFDLVVDLVGDGKAPNARRQATILFNGQPGDEALVASIMASGLPQIAIRDEQGQIAATAQPSAELAKGVSGSMDQTYARVITLLTAWVGHADRWTEPLFERQASLPSPKALFLKTAKSVLRSEVMRLYYALFRAGHWRVGWRWVDEDDVWSRRSLAGEPWQVLRDTETHLYADPVPWVEEGRHYLFFEDLDQRTQKGMLSVVEFDEKGQPGPTQVCLEEPYHLSYPYMIRHQGVTYMIPETSANGDVALYRAKNFPLGWERERVLMSGLDAADVTITEHDGKWWIFCVTRDGAGGYSDCLSIFYADDLFGPWHPHAQNPVLIDKATARPAGNFVRDGDRLFRPVQDCTTSYGAALKLVEVTHLTPEHYEQRVLETLHPNAYWPGRKLHTLNRVGNLEVIDGAILRPRWSLLRKLAEWIYRPKGAD